MKERKLEWTFLRASLYLCMGITAALAVLTPYFLRRFGYQGEYCYSLWAIAAAFLAAVWQLRGIIASVANGEPFARKNVRRLKVIAYCCLAVSLASLAMLPVYFSLVKVLMALLAFVGMLVMRVLAWVFQAAVLQKEEMDYVI